MNAFIKVVLGLAVIAAFGAAGLFGTQYLLASDSSASDSRPGRQAVRVGVASPEQRLIENSVTAVGTMRPARMVDLVPSAVGRVAEVPVASAQTVGAGALILQLDDRSEQAALREAEATLAEARQAFERIEELADRNTAADARLEEARAAFRRAESAVEGAKANLEDRSLRAPFAGTLGLVDIEPGAFADRTSSVTRLSDLSVMEAEFTLPERYFSRVSPGLEVEITTPAFDGEVFAGRVTVRVPEVDLSTRSFAVRAEIDNTERRLVGGMFANARIVIDEYEGLAVPDDAIISEGLTSHVYIVADGTAQRVEVVPGASLGELTAVEGELSAEAQVVVAGWDTLSDGASVQIDEGFEGEGLQ